MGWLSWPSAQPPYDAGDAVDRDLRAIRDVARRVEHPEHHRNAALARERRQVRGRAAEFRHDARDARQDMAERRPRHFRHQNVAGRDTRKLAFTAHHPGLAGASTDARRMAIKARMLEPDLVRHMRGLNVQWPRLQQLETFIVERPLDLDRRTHQRLGLADDARA